MNKLTLQALAFTGILAVSGLPAFAAEMTPASPAPNASISTDSKAKVATPKNSVEKTKSTAAKTEKNSKKVAKNTKTKVHKQTAQHPAPIPPVGGSAGANTSVGAGNAGVSGSAGAAVQH